ncbi:MAG: hypothetical protein A3D65_03140 [Candidatus Lloydbacteria bacterium RIFCSPHIGHO2_02_FULL_50_13]|uniref:asparagine synthase (glutamine-hydrolyzing) n=1 Tax=Candidatus Lloydbacteria bacterium RIFCSPHIGHO2_02_FULL_50_13 TaxID=1798661 RepID=A0A1G2D7N7_9BACT|nr:MAG: hypothetical protein A3D65_03140 [Candidatus Lloydbacteria bacterium RIFCSPHIGHO2_02_FULL_50_13]
MFSDEHVTLGQNLLAITETPIFAKQPYVSPDGNFVLVYNGEIYNYKNLRNELKSEGAVFHTEWDTEVLFEGLMRHGASFIEKLDGMFALASGLTHPHNPQQLSHAGVFSATKLYN